MTNSRTTGPAELCGSRLSVSFKGVQALDDVNIQVGAGEIVALVGPNGSGKTTCLNVLTGFGHLDAGTVHLDGDDVTSHSVPARAAGGVGRTFQNPRLSGVGRVGDLLQAGWHLRDSRGLPRSVFRPRWTRHVGDAAQEAARASLDRVGMSHVPLDARISELSHGQIKLLDIARALLGEPRVLLLDEPTSGLSPNEANDVAALVAGLGKEGISILVVEHNVGFVLGVARRVTVLSGGKIVASGEPVETMRRPEVIEAYLGGVATKSRRPSVAAPLSRRSATSSEEDVG